MKKIFLFAAAAAMMVLASCNKESQPESVSVVNAGPSRVTLGISSIATKATIDDTEAEAKVNSIQVFVFNGDAVDAYHNASASEIAALRVEVNATAGVRDIYAFVNANDLSSYTSKVALLGATTTLGDNGYAADSFVMSGKLLSQTLTASYSNTILVDRYTSRIRIHKITRNFSGGLAAVAFRINRIYLTSAVTNERYDFGAPAEYSWINKSFGPVSGRALATSNAFVYQALGTPAVVANSASYQPAVPHSFYAYANVNANVSAGDSGINQTYRNTRLVVECQVDTDNDGSFEADEFYTYPISMGAIGNNKSYEINELVLTMLGNPSDGDDNADDGEDDDISKVVASFSISVNDWEEVLVGVNGTVTI